VNDAAPLLYCTTLFLLSVLLPSSTILAMFALFRSRLKFKKMKLFTKEGFSIAFQVLSLILLIGYEVSKSDEAPNETLSNTHLVVSQPAILLKIPIYQLVVRNQSNEDNSMEPYTLKTANHVLR
jgi:hypothetical protein